MKFLDLLLLLLICPIFLPLFFPIFRSGCNIRCRYIIKNTIVNTALKNMKNVIDICYDKEGSGCYTTHKHIHFLHCYFCNSIFATNVCDALQSNEHFCSKDCESMDMVRFAMSHSIEEKEVLDCIIEFNLEHE